MNKLRMTSVASFSIPYLQFLDEKSSATQAFPDFADDKTLLQMYREMSLIRAFDNKAINLQRTGQMGTYPAARGQEAVGIGMGHALQKGDVFCPYYRDQAVFLARGIGLLEWLTYWGGDERGSNYSEQIAKEDFPVCVPIAGQLLHAAGVAFAFKYRKQKNAALTVCGDGGTSKGDFYEAINLAGDWHLPVVFVVNNNQWAISVSREDQTACKTLAQKAIAGGFEGVQVDGNDVIAVRYAVAHAMEKAREGGGPTLIEAVTYRLCDHTTADDAKRYTPAEQIKSAWKFEPIARLGHYLESKNIWSREKELELQQELAKEVEKIVEQYMQRSKPKPTDMFDFLYETLPVSLQAQRDELMQEVKA